MLLKYAGGMDACFPGQDRLAKDMGTARQSVNGYIRELREAGLISVERRGQGCPNLYTVQLKASFWRRRK